MQQASGPQEAAEQLGAAAGLARQLKVKLSVPFTGRLRWCSEAATHAVVTVVAFAVPLRRETEAQQEPAGHEASEALVELIADDC